jgi:hypothetical protein
MLSLLKLSLRQDSSGNNPARSIEIQGPQHGGIAPQQEGPAEAQLDCGPPDGVPLSPISTRRRLNVVTFAECRRCSRAMSKCKRGVARSLPFKSRNLRLCKDECCPKVLSTLAALRHGYARVIPSRAWRNLGLGRHIAIGPGKFAMLWLHRIARDASERLITRFLRADLACAKGFRNSDR